MTGAGGRKYLIAYNGYRSGLGNRVRVVLAAKSLAALATTLEVSPVQWFVTRMQEIRRTDPDVEFFVSCDVPEVQRDVMARVGGCHAQTDKGPYNSTEAVRSAVADLYLLACSGYLLGPYMSSFVHLSEYLSGDVLRLETAKTGPPDRVDFRTAGVVPDPLKPYIR